MSEDELDPIIEELENKIKSLRETNDLLLETLQDRMDEVANLQATIKDLTYKIKLLDAEEARRKKKDRRKSER